AGFAARVGTLEQSVEDRACFGDLPAETESIRHQKVERGRVEAGRVRCRLQTSGQVVDRTTGDDPGDGECVKGALLHLGPGIRCRIERLLRQAFGFMDSGNAYGREEERLPGK